MVKLSLFYDIEPPYILDTFTKLERSESENKNNDKQTAADLRGSD